MSSLGRGREGPDSYLEVSSVPHGATVVSGSVLVARAPPRAGPVWLHCMAFRLVASSSGLHIPFYGCPLSPRLLSLGCGWVLASAPVRLSFCLLGGSTLPFHRALYFRACRALSQRLGVLWVPTAACGVLGQHLLSLGLVARDQVTWIRPRRGRAVRS